MREDNGFQQGFYFGQFLRFLWLLLIAFIYQTMIMYMFGINIFTLYVLTLIISFFINTSFQIRQGYPFFRHLLIYLCLFFSLTFFATSIIGKLDSLFVPDGLWITFMILSLIFGIIHSFGRYNNGLQSHKIELLGTFVLLILLVLVFIFYWWQGGVIYLIFRIPMMFVEVMISNVITGYLYHKATGEDETGLFEQ